VLVVATAVCSILDLGINDSLSILVRHLAPLIIVAGENRSIWHVDSFVFARSATVALVIALTIFILIIFMFISIGGRGARRKVRQVGLRIL
jgi:hypothetical protein